MSKKGKQVERPEGHKADREEGNEADGSTGSSANHDAAAPSILVDLASIDLHQVEAFRNRNYFDPGNDDKYGATKVIRCRVEIRTSAQEAQRVPHPIYPERWVIPVVVYIHTDNREHERNQAGRSLTWDMPMAIMNLIVKHQPQAELRGLMLDLVSDPKRGSQRYCRTIVISCALMNNNQPQRDVEPITDKPVPEPEKDSKSFADHIAGWTFNPHNRQCNVCDLIATLYRHDESCGEQTVENVVLIYEHHGLDAVNWLGQNAYKWVSARTISDEVPQMRYVQKLERVCRAVKKAFNDEWNERQYREMMDAQDQNES